MTNTISKSSIIPDVWKNFRDRIASQVTTTTITGSVVVNVQNYISSFPDIILNSKSNYPIIVIEDPNTPTDSFTGTKTQIEGSIKVGVYANQSEAASKLIAKIIDSIETYKPDLSKVGIRQIKIGDTSQDFFNRNKIKVHYREVVFDFLLFYNNAVGF